MSRRPMSLNLGPVAEAQKETGRRLRNLEGGHSLAHSSIPGVIPVEPGGGIDFTEGHAIGIPLEDLPKDTTPPPVPAAPDLSMAMGGVIVRAAGPEMPEDFSNYRIETSRDSSDWVTRGEPIAHPLGATVLYGLDAGTLSVRLVAVDTTGNASDPGPAATITVVPIETAEQVKKEYLAKQAEVDAKIQVFEEDLEVVDGRAQAAESAATAAEARATEANNRAMTRLANGNFEDGEKYWRFLAGASLATDGHSGAQSALLPPGGRVIPESALPVVAGQIWEIQLYAQPQTAPSTDGVQVAFAKPGEEQTGPYYSQTRVSGPTGEWSASGSVRITIPEDMDQLSFWVVNPWAETATFAVDDISLRDVTDVVRLENAANAAREKADDAERVAKAVELAQGGIRDRLDASEQLQQDAGLEAGLQLGTMESRVTRAFQSADTTTKEEAVRAAVEADKAKLDAVLKNGSTKVFTNMAVLSHGVNNTPGLIVFDTPIPFSNYMTTISFEGYNYVTGASDIRADVSFYAYSVGPAFYHRSYTSSGSCRVEVTIARKVDTGTVSIIFNREDDANWFYTKLAATKMVIGQSTAPNTFQSGWTARLVPALEAGAYDRITEPDAYDARKAVETAQDTADGAVASANGKNANHRDTTAPSGNGKTVGDTWTQFTDDTYSKVKYQWTWDGNTWGEPYQLDYTMLGSVDIATLSVIGESRLPIVVSEQVFSDLAAFNDVFARRMVVSNGANLIPNPRIEDAGSGWTKFGTGNSTLGYDAGAIGKGILIYANGGSHGYTSERFSVEAEKKHSFSYYLYHSLTGTSPVAYVRMHWLDKNGAPVPVAPGSNVHYSDSNTTSGSGTKTFTVTPPLHATTAYLQVFVYNGSTGGYFIISNFQMMPKVDTVLIEEGAVHADNVFVDENLTAKIFGAETGVIEWLTVTEKADFQRGLNSTGENWLDGVLLKEKSVTAELINLITDNGTNRLRLDDKGLLLETMGGRPIMRLDPSGLRGYNPAGTETFAFDPATGQLKAVDGVFSGKVTGSEITGSSFETKPVGDQYVGYAKMEFDDDGIRVLWSPNVSGPWTVRSDWNAPADNLIIGSVQTAQLTADGPGLPVYGEMRFYDPPIGPEGDRLGNDEWVDLTYAGSWSAHTAIAPALRVRREGETVRMEGSAIGGTGVIAAIPNASGLRPTRPMVLTGIGWSNGTHAPVRVTVNEFGQITVPGWLGTWISFDGLTYALT